jgi:hypothetical protein
VIESGLHRACRLRQLESLLLQPESGLGVQRLPSHPLCDGILVHPDLLGNLLDCCLEGRIVNEVEVEVFQRREHLRVEVGCAHLQVGQGLYHVRARLGILHAVIEVATG